MVIHTVFFSAKLWTVPLAVAMLLMLSVVMALPTVMTQGIAGNAALFVTQTAVFS